MKKAILFDLGNTLIRYYSRSEFPEILNEAIAEVYELLTQSKYIDASFDDVWQRVSEENHESPDYAVRTLEDRLERIFAIPEPSDDLMMSMCRCFMKPIFSKSRIYDDTLPVLSRLKSSGIKIAIISNTAWGSPAELWREEIERFGLQEYIDLAVFCRDVGWRKPDSRAFDFALKSLSLTPSECVFIGDDARWDIAGPRAIGMDAILIDREGKHDDEKNKICELYEIFDILKIGGVV